MRWLGLYLRSRHVPGALVAVVVATAALRAAVHERNGPVLAVLAVGFGAAVLGAGLGGADPALERTAAIRWPLRRGLHVLAIAAVVVAAVAAAGFAPVGLVLRAAVGLAGLTALGAAVLGRRLSWAPPVVWAGVAAVVPVTGGPLVVRVLTWPAQPPDAPAATAAAVVLGVVGLAHYAAVGAREQRASVS
ncbi:hypothetical protein GCM10009660_54390 [Catellatospora bangladeshensis]